MRFVPNPSFLREVRREPAFDAYMGANAEKVKATARTLTALGADSRRGHFANRYAVEWVDGVPRVGNTDQSFIHLLEFGSANNRPQAPLRRAVKAVGLRLDEAPKK